MAAALGAKLPQSVAFRLLGGERGLEQVPDPHERQEMLARCLRKIAGPQGDTLQQAERALEILEVHAELSASASELCLPVSAALAHKLIYQEHCHASDKGLQGGSTMGGALRQSFVWLSEKLKLDISLDETVVSAAAPPQGKRKT